MKNKSISMNKYKNKKYVIALSIGAGALVLTLITLILIFRHVHTFSEWERVRDASCTQHGLERRFCACGEMQEKQSDKLPHTESEWIYDKDKDNLRKICTVCGKNLQFNSLEGHTHVWSEVKITKAPTCSENGSSLRNCDCGAYLESVLPMTDHNFGEWVLIHEPECEKDGIRTRTCSSCKTEDKETIPALSHTEGIWTVENGQKLYHCIYCDTLMKAEEIIYSQYLDISNGEVMGIGSCEDFDIAIPETSNGEAVTKIGDYSFEYQRITGLIINNSIISIGKKAFYKCEDLVQIYFGSNLTHIGEKAFMNCSSLKTISLPQTMKAVSKFAFSYCTSLEYIYLEAGIDTLEDGVFIGCTSLKEIRFNGTVEQWNNIKKGSNWDTDTGSYTVYCNDGSITK